MSIFAPALASALAVMSVAIAIYLVRSRQWVQSIEAALVAILCGGLAAWMSVTPAKAQDLQTGIYESKGCPSAGKTCQIAVQYNVFAGTTVVFEVMEGGTRTCQDEAKVSQSGGVLMGTWKSTPIAVKLTMTETGEFDFLGKGLTCAMQGLNENPHRFIRIGDLP